MACSPLRILGIIFITFFLSACISGGSAPVDNAWNNIGSTQIQHKVQPGETLYTIAWRYDIDYKSLAEWNHLQPPYNLQLGQVIRLTAPASAPSTTTTAPVPAEKGTPIPAAPAFKPTSAAENGSPVIPASPAISTAQAVVGTGNWPWPVKGKIIESFGQDGNKGIDIATPVGTPVIAVQPGTVVYAGSNLHGYGQLIIIRQPNDLMTAYAHNSKLLVKMDQKVIQGQKIALSGDTEASRPMLHFEIRRANKSLNPINYLKETP